MLPTLTIFGWEFSTYWMMFVVGVVGMAVLCCLRAKRYRLSYLKAVLFSLMLALCGLLGTKLLYILENWSETIQTGITLGGQSFFGALFLVPFFVAIYGKIFKLHPMESTDFCAAPVIFILTCMRLGCAMSGCCAGICIGTFQWPAQLMEACADSALLVYILTKEVKAGAKGQLYPVLMLVYGSYRFFLEFIRDTVKDWLFLSHGQWFSIVAVAVGMLWLTKVKKGAKS